MLKLALRNADEMIAGAQEHGMKLHVRRELGLRPRHPEGEEVDQSQRQHHL